MRPSTATSESLTAGTTGTDLYGERRDVLVMRVDGRLWDLAREVPEGATVEAVTIGEPDGLMVLRHSTAHVLAQAVQQVNPDAKPGRGSSRRERLLLRLRRRDPLHPGGPQEAGEGDAAHR
ncbi:hypothetical protein GCM10025876_00810 [Demequina litorisediminis]|uniref:TGS domain-containing protein n=1 Tax=Demequina litorisediminis TaxID=1849022 RepID=A0ABQ6IA46_9MICO|nr:hypothetical protein GCM10025876_00810 [Demequina litorisediminis]